MTQSLESDLFAANEIVLPAPACDGTLTPEQTEGPYYTADTPERNSLFEPGMAGQRLLVVGYVLDTNCQPTSNAWLDFWQADASGQYDNQGYVLRGHQFTDSQGRYVLETVIPGEYPGRTQHIHVKLQRPGGQVVTSQLYFPGSGSNASDGIFDAALLVTLEERGDYTVAYYNFVLR
jgi:protocatechuate 3,4-dioxygenase beta subunit